MSWLRRLPALPLLLLLVLALSGSNCPLANDEGSQPPPDDTEDCDDVYIDGFGASAIVSTGGAWSAAWHIQDGLPPFSAAVAAGALPEGVQVTVEGDTLRLSGSPLEDGIFQATLRVTDSCAGSRPDDVTVKLTVIDPGSCPPLAYLGLDRSILTLGAYVGVHFQLEGGFGHRDAEVVSGMLPPGLGLAGGDLLLGTPSAVGVYDFRLRFSDDCPDGGSSVEADISIEVSADFCEPLTTRPLVPDVAVVGEPFGVSLFIGLGVEPFTFELLDPENLPPGLAQSEVNSNVVHGTPTQAGVYTYVMRVTDGCPLGAQVLDQPCTITVLPAAGECEPLQAGALDVATAVRGEPYAGSFPISGGTPPYRVSFGVGQLPLGITQDSSGGNHLVGRPVFAGVYDIAGTVRDFCPYGDQELPVTLTLTVTDPGGGCAPLVYADTPLPVAHVDAPYDYTLPVTGGEGQRSWTLLEFAAPAMEFVDGRIVGTPFASGTFPLECYVIDSCPGEPGYVYISTTLTIEP